MPDKKLVQSLPSEQDLIDIWQYIAKDQPINADRFLDQLNDAMQRLVQMPKIGTPRPELINGLRSYCVGQYIIYYRIKGDFLEVVRVLSTSRDLELVDW